MLMIKRKVILQTLRIHQLFDKHPQLKDIGTRIDVMTYKFGEFVKFFKIYAKAYNGLSAGYTAEAIICLSALLIHIDLFCVVKGWDIDTLRDEGYQHLVDKISEVEAKGGKII